MDQTEVQQLIHQALSQQEQLLSTTISELRAELIATKAELSSIKTNIIDSLLARQTTDVRPKPVLPDVDKFDGSLSMWEVWYPEIQAKLRIDDLTFGQSEEVKFWYIYNRLEKKIQALVTPQLAAAERRKVYKYQDLFDQLARLCDSPNAKRNAEDKLGSLRQFPDQSFNLFLAAFERQLYKAEADEWSDDAKIALLRRQLNERMKKRLRTQITTPTTYIAFVKVLQQLDDGGSTQTSSPSTHQHAPSKSGEPMDIGNVQVSSMTVAHNDSEDSEDDEGPRVRLLYNADTGKYRKVRV